MRIRKDGEATRRQLLSAARQVFGERGYSKATNAAISREAGVNAALIGFHFGSKDGLYRAVWDDGEAEAKRLYPCDGGVSESASAEDRFCAMLAALVGRATDKRLESFHRIQLAEFVNPTGLLGDRLLSCVREHRERLLGVLRELLGSRATESDALFCEMSVISQCRVIHDPAFDSTKQHSRPPFWDLCRRDPERFLAHIIRFSLAGIADVRRSIEARASEHEESDVTLVE